MGKIQGMFIVPHPPIIISELGRGREQEAKKTLEGMEKVLEKIKTLHPDTLVVITPHGQVDQDQLAFLKGEKASGSLASFGFPQLKMSKALDTVHIEKMQQRFLTEKLPGTFVEGELDHGAFVPLYFINQVLAEVKLIHISIGMLEMKELYNLGEKIRQVLLEGEGKFTIIVSGDLSHRLKADGPYGFDEKGVDFDRRIVNAIKRCNVLDIMNMPKEVYHPAAECGLRPMVLGFGVLGHESLTSQVFSYEGPFGVGYMNAWVQKSS